MVSLKFLVVVGQAALGTTDSGSNSAVSAITLMQLATNQLSVEGRELAWSLSGSVLLVKWY